MKRVSVKFGLSTPTLYMSLHVAEKILLRTTEDGRQCDSITAGVHVKLLYMYLIATRGSNK